MGTFRLAFLAGELVLMGLGLEQPRVLRGGKNRRCRVRCSNGGDSLTLGVGLDSGSWALFGDDYTLSKVKIPTSRAYYEREMGHPSVED